MYQFATAAEIQAKHDEAIRLFEQGLSNSEIARQIDVARKNVSQWCQLWRAGGEDALRVKRGSKPRLTDEQWQHVTAALLDGPQAPGYETQLWTLERIADLI